MIVGVDLVLETLERALEATILPGVANAAAREEAWLGGLFAGWLRDVVDHAVDLERLSHRECLAALAEVSEIIGTGNGGRASTRVQQMAGIILIPTPDASIAEVRDERRRIKGVLSRALRAAREDEDEETALAIRARLVLLAGREIERELAFARATGMDPDAASVTPLGKLLERERRQNR